MRPKTQLIGLKMSRIKQLPLELTDLTDTLYIYFANGIVREWATEIVVDAALREIFVIFLSVYFLQGENQPTHVRPRPCFVFLCSAAICFSSSLSKRGNSSAVTWADATRTAGNVCSFSFSRISLGLGRDFTSHALSFTLKIPEGGKGGVFHSATFE